MCGIIGILSNNEVVSELYDGLMPLQHRGQDSSGIATYDGKFHIKKGMGLVREVFNERSMKWLTGNMGVGQTRYITASGPSLDEAQPFMIFSPYGFSMVHNGNLTNYDELREELMQDNLRLVNSGSDSEIIMHVLANEMRKTVNQKGKFETKLFKAVKGTSRRLKGSYSIIVSIAGKGLLAFRDPNGIRPLVMGVRKRSSKESYIFASENTMFNALDFKFLGDVEPGEAVFVDYNTRKVSRKKYETKERNICIFEYIYFARPDAMIDGISVYRARLRLGQALAKKIKKQYKDLKVDVVVPAPSSANTAALTLAHDLGIKYREGLVKNNFVGRTFIMPGQKQRKKSIKYKLSALELELKKKNVLIVDDSIVRGNTSKEIIELVRRAGAKKVYLAVASAPLRWPCMYGIDMPVRKDFVADKLNIEQIKKKIGADELIYQDPKEMIRAVIRKGKHYVKKPCSACFDGNYPTKEVTPKLLKKIEQDRLAAYRKFGFLAEEKEQERVAF